MIPEVMLEQAPPGVRVEVVPLDSVGEIDHLILAPGEEDRGLFEMDGFSSTILTSVQASGGKIVKRG